MIVQGSVTFMVLSIYLHYVTDDMGNVGTNTERSLVLIGLNDCGSVLYGIVMHYYDH